MLLDAGADVDAGADDKITALMLASAFGQADVIRLLLDAGANVHAHDA